jgi:hypothetical protein
MTNAPLPPGCCDPDGAAEIETGLEQPVNTISVGQSPASREYLMALQSTRFSDLAALRQAGVDGPGLAIGPAFASIQMADGRFQLDTHGDAKAFVLPVRVGNPLTAEVNDPIKAVRHGTLIDLIALSPAYPNQWALRLGNATWLGAIEPQFLMPEPVPVWRTPLAWLRNDCRGLVLLSPVRSEQYRVLTVCDSIVAEDERHAAELREVLDHPWLAPPVYSRRRREVRDAA